MTPARIPHPLTWDLLRRGDGMRPKRFHGAIFIRYPIVFRHAV